MNPLYNQLNGGNINPMFSRIKQFKDTFSGDPKQMVQQMLNSGKITQSQYNQAVQRVQELQRMFN